MKPPLEEGKIINEKKETERRYEHKKIRIQKNPLEYRYFIDFIDFNKNLEFLTFHLRFIQRTINSFRSICNSTYVYLMYQLFLFIA